MSRFWFVLERFSVVFGVLSGIVWVWALIYPGRAVEAVENYQDWMEQTGERLDDIKGDTEEVLDITKKTKEDTKRLVKALPKGILLDGVLMKETGCSAAPHPEDELSIYIVNQEERLLKNAFVKVLDESGATIFEEKGTFFNALSVYSLDIQSRVRLARLCFGAKDDDGQLLAVEYEVIGWRKSFDNCAQNPNYGFRMFEPALSEVAVKDLTLCE